MAAMAETGMGRGCCLQYSWPLRRRSWLSVTSTSAAGSRLRAGDPRACDGWTTVRPLWLFGGAKSLHTRSVELHHLELVRIDSVETAHVDHHHVLAARTFAVGVGLDAASRAERVMNGALVELKIRHFTIARDQLEIGRVGGRQQRSEFPAARTITRDDLADVGLHFVAHGAALTAAGV